MTMRCLLGVLLILIRAAIQVHSQGDFISIDCGLSIGVDYTNPGTTIQYTSDTQYIDTGKNYNIQEQYNARIGGKPYETLRSFPEGARNCYKLPSTPWKMYLVRATFSYGNYDQLDSTTTNGLVFGLHIGANFWSTVNLTSIEPTDPVWREVLTVAPDKFVSVCLVNMGLGTPFISTLEMRPLDAFMYPFVNTSVSANNIYRQRFGQISEGYITRYPVDQFDRFWERSLNFSYPLLNMSSATPVRAPPGTDYFQVPSAIMQCAATIAANFSWFYVTIGAQRYGTGNVDAGLRLLPVFHFAELNATATRTFSICNDDDVLFPAFTPSKHPVAMFNSWVLRNGASSTFTLRRSPASPLPPLINAVEVYSLVAMENTTTGAGEVDSMEALKKQYNVTMRNWQGDPCSPREYAWEGVSCDYSSNSAFPTILRIDLSTSGLNGTINSVLANMTALTFLDLSNNKLTGSVPDNLATLNSLQVLNLSQNQLTGPVPDALIRKSQSGLLKLRLEDNPLCFGVATSYCKTTKEKNSAAVVAVALIVPLVVVLIVSLVIWRLRCKGRSKDDDSYLMEEDASQLHIDTRRFTYAELQVVTSRFKRVLGKGGFGTVYHGSLEDGNEIAVKMLMESSIVESKDFLPEVQILSRAHHRNLVSLVGYCPNRRYLALVYEFMPRGNLQELLRGEECDLSWGERLHIAVDAAQGLEYLHEACSPPIVHRDVKTANILLDEKLVAKIADFGLSRAFQTNAHTHISTVVAGTLGYLDPQYHATYQLTTKTDVYSFGVVLLEMVTGKPSVFTDLQEAVHIAWWVRQKLATGTLNNVVDGRLGGQYDAKSAQIVIDLAMRCLTQSSVDRPSMADVVARLKESLLLVSCEDEYNLDHEEVINHKNVLELEIPRQHRLVSEGTVCLPTYAKFASGDLFNSLDSVSAVSDTYTWLSVSKDAE